ncbi:MAG: two-component regulator propeller domain-containing protein [Anaerolineae bacterium]
MEADRLIIQVIRLWICKYYTSISKNISKYLTIILVLWICFSACTGKYLQETQTVEAQQTNQEIASTKVTSTQATTDITTLHQTVTPEALATKTLDIIELIPGFRPEAWTVFPNSSLDIHHPNESFAIFRVNDIAEDSNGTMWFATTYRLVNFDGTKWLLVYEYKDTIVNSFVDVCEDGSVWFTTSDGVYKYYSGSIIPQLFLGEHRGYDIHSMSVSDDGKVWIALSDEIRVFYEGEWHSLSEDLPSSQISDMVVDDRGGVYISWSDTSIKGGIAYYLQGNWKIFDNEYIQTNNRPDDTHFAATPLVIDDQGHLWFYEWRTGLYEYFNGEFILHTLHTKELFTYHPSSLVKDNSGDIWLGGGIPLALYVPGTDHLQSIDGSYEFYIYPENGSDHPAYPRYKGEGIIPFEQVSALYIDSKNQLWIATELGIYVLDLESGFPVTPSS